MKGCDSSDRAFAYQVKDPISGEGQELNQNTFRRKHGGKCIFDVTKRTQTLWEKGNKLDLIKIKKPLVIQRTLLGK
jgi:hypothetical protein